MMIGIMANFPRRRVAVLTARVAVLINVIFRFLEFVFFFPILVFGIPSFRVFPLSYLFIFGSENFWVTRKICFFQGIYDSL